MKLKIISDGTNAGTKLIDEDTGEMVHLIQNLSWECSADKVTSKVVIELLNVPVDIITKAEVELSELVKDNGYASPVLSKSFEKEIRIVSEIASGKSVALSTLVYDTTTKEPVNAIQKVKWKANTKGRKAKVKRIKFDNKDWQ